MALYTPITGFSYTSGHDGSDGLIISPNGSMTDRFLPKIMFFLAQFPGQNVHQPQNRFFENQDPDFWKIGQLRTSKFEKMITPYRNSGSFGPKIRKNGAMADRNLKKQDNPTYGKKQCIFQILAK